MKTFKNGDKVITIDDYAYKTTGIGKPQIGLILTVDFQDDEIVTMINRDEYHIEELEKLQQQ